MEESFSQTFRPRICPQPHLAWLYLWRPWRWKVAPCRDCGCSLLSPTHVGTRTSINLDDLTFLDEERNLDGLAGFENRRLHDIA